MGRESKKDLMDRIARMQEAMDMVGEMVDCFHDDIDYFIEAYDSMVMLLDYYSSGQWEKDYESDEMDKMPRVYKRGILSPDGLGELLEDLGDLRLRVMALADSFSDPDNLPPGEDTAPGDADPINPFSSFPPKPGPKGPILN